MSDLDTDVKMNLFDQSVDENVSSNGMESNMSSRTWSETDARIASLERLITSRFDAEAQRDIEKEIERTAATTQHDVNTGNAALSVALIKGQGDLSTQAALNAAALGTEIAKTSGELNTQAALNASALGVQVAKTSGDTNTQVALNTSAVGVALQKGIGDLNTQNALTSSALGVQVAKTASDNQQLLVAGQGSTNTHLENVASTLGVQASKGFGDVSTEISQSAAATALGIKDILIDAGQHYAATQLTALTNAKDVSAGVALARHELAALTTAQHEHTQRAIEATRFDVEKGNAAIRIEALKTHNELQRQLDQLARQAERDAERLHRHVETKADENLRLTERKNDEVLAKLGAQEVRALEIQLAEKDRRLVELLGDKRECESHRRANDAVNVTNTNTNDAIATAFQQQQQQQFQTGILSAVQQLANQINIIGNQSARATNTNYDIGNSGINAFVPNNTSSANNIR